MEEQGVEITADEVTILPDGSAFGVLCLPLPEDHWLTSPGPVVPPMPLRCGEGAVRDKLAKMVWQAGQYAVRAATDCGKVMDFDPDALCRQLVVGLLGYWTADGTGSGLSQNPEPLPPLFDGRVEE